MRYLAFDLGTRFGWAEGSVAVRTPKNELVRINSGWVDLKNDRYSGGGMRYVKFRTQLEALNVKAAKVVFFEEVRRHAGTTAAHVYGGLLATLTAYCEDHCIPYQGFPVGEIKKFATGNGNANKEKMLTAASAVVGHTLLDDNEADAIHILRLGLYHLGVKLGEWTCKDV